MQKILVATTNPGKAAEIAHLLSDLKVEVLSLRDVHVTDDVEESETTYKGNSQKKALFYAKKSGLPVVTDDGGIEIEALGGMPGLHSKRWVGEPSTDKKILEKMHQVAKELKDNRTAYFKTVVSLGFPDGRVFSTSGQVKGIIAKKPLVKLMSGFPYRSYFYLPQIKKYYHERDLTEEEMKEYNHRYIAIAKLKKIIKKELHI